MSIFNKDNLFAYVGERVHSRPVSYFISDSLMLLNVNL